MVFMDGYRGSESRTSSETSELTGYESGELAQQVLSSETLSLSLLGYVVADFVFILITVGCRFDLPFEGCMIFLFFLSL